MKHLLHPRQRAGVLTQPAVMARLGHVDGSAPILRGAMVLSRVLCSPTPPPPVNVADQAAQAAKSGCPVSKALAAVPMTLDAALES